jgi:hypothetical protein
MASKDVDAAQMAKHLLTISQHIAKGLKADAAKAAQDAQKKGK